MEDSVIVNSIGLSLDIVGVLLLFFYGLPSKFKKPPKLLLEGEITREARRKNADIKFWSHLGLIFLIIGFIFQLLSNFIK
jgi:hypothetical protein